MAINPISVQPFQQGGDINFSSLAQLPQVYQKARDEANVRDTLATLGQGGQVDPTQLIQSGNLTLANMGFTLQQRQAEQVRQAAQDARQAERDKVGDTRADREFSANQAYRNAQLGIARENQDYSPQERAQMAGQYGIQPGSPEFKTFVLTGALPQAKERVQKLKDENGEYLSRENPDGSFTRIDPAAAPGSPAATPAAPTNPFSYGTQKEGESKDSGYASRMFRAEGILRSPESIAAATSRTQRAIDQAPIVGSSGYTGLGNSVQSKEYQKYDQAARDFINATLRRESGAAISESEFENAYRQYLPRPGDSHEVLREKQRNRQETIGSIAGGGGKNYRPPFTFDQQGSMVPLAPGAKAVPTTATNTPPQQGNRTSTGVQWSIEP